MTEEQNSKREGFDMQGEPVLTHDQPIIIDGTGSVILEFDGGDHEHYEPDDPEEPTEYTGEGLRIDKVIVRVPGRPLHLCPLPEDRRCTVLIVGRGPSHDDPIEVDGSDGETIVISPDEEYRKEHTGSNRKRHRSGVHRIRSLTIQPASGGEPHACNAIPSNGKCKILIDDIHIS